MRVTKRFRFDAAHHLPGYEGKCARVHGHGYVLEISVEGPVGADGFVMDFYDLKSVVNEQVVDRLDHRDLNDIHPYPTAENIALWIWERLADALPRMAELKLYETPDSWVTLTREDA